MSKDYDDLINEFEGKESGKAKPSRRASNAKNNQNANAHKGGVYFSNPPRNMSGEGQGPHTDVVKPISDKANKRLRAAKAPKKAETGAVPPVTPDMPKGNRFDRLIRSKGFKNFWICFAVVVGVSAILCFYGIRCINDVLALNVTDEKNVAVEVSVKEGMSDSEVIDILHDNDLINNKGFCKMFVKFFRVKGDYIEGVYTLTPNMGVEKMLGTMKTDFKKSETITLTFPEGWTTLQIAEKLEANGVCSASSFISTVRTIDFSDEYSFLQTIDNKEKRFYVLEGYIYPDTYEFYKGENPSSVVRRFLDNFNSKWSEEYTKLAEERDMTIDEVINLASIIQKEAANKEQMADISSVLVNRLDKPNAFPLLQCDSTEDYLLKTIKPSLGANDTERYIQYRDSYDTYSEACEGLPVGPISNPGNDAIHAALKPSDTSYLYFRHDAKGGVYYADTFAEHEANGEKAAAVE